MGKQFLEIKMIFETNKLKDIIPKIFCLIVITNHSFATDLNSQSLENTFDSRDSKIKNDSQNLHECLLELHVGKRGPDFLPNLIHPNKDDNTVRNIRTYTWQECYQEAISFSLKYPIASETIELFDTYPLVQCHLYYVSWNFKENISSYYNSNGFVTRDSTSSVPKIGNQIKKPRTNDKNTVWFDSYACDPYFIPNSLL